MSMKSLSAVLDAATAEGAVKVLTGNPGSLVTSTGPQWIAETEARAVIAGCAVSFLIAGDGEDPVGVVLVRRMQTPGHLRLDIVSGDDSRMTAEKIGDSLREAVDFLTAASEVARIDMCFGVYNEPLLQYAVDAPGFRFEGVLRDAFFAAGQYWEGVIVSITGADIAAVRSADGAEPAARYRAIASRVAERITVDLATHCASGAR
ncbi:hypothetical protein ERC79_20215 [Rhodococcus sp. ABRD24]|uniref:hypothetical protein n=1 Tax=Rhodococcus sp. ABRD24 TaxID=2507582 RepID=UPI0010399C25|nr:hypothetical protein [Rhodococcus sp. ABRD24]QBJ98003.1 hypothetical protein ERC79_20215 [Rhodococcus sp. ABRD24]